MRRAFAVLYRAKWNLETKHTLEPQLRYPPVHDVMFLQALSQRREALAFAVKYFWH